MGKTNPNEIKGQEGRMSIKESNFSTELIIKTRSQSPQLRFLKKSTGNGLYLINFPSLLGLGAN
ncbi:MAG: hypothetical protein CMI18_09330 [Opitutaceae bacterium]|nr:hypothetical protein [Opitutaceae bacterium]